MDYLSKLTASSTHFISSDLLIQITSRAKETELSYIEPGTQENIDLVERPDEIIVFKIGKGSWAEKKELDLFAQVLGIKLSYFSKTLF